MKSIWRTVRFVAAAPLIILIVVTLSLVNLWYDLREGGK